MPEAYVAVSDRRPLPVRINGSSPTFIIDTEKIEAKLLSPMQGIFEDLLEIACTVFAADGTFRRGGPSRPHMGTGWRRDFIFDIPVRNPSVWTDHNVLQALRNVVGFLTDDDVEFRFSHATGNPSPQSCFQFDERAEAFRPDEVILFSGGLDSFAGALDALATRNQKVVLVTHVSAPKVAARQKRLADYLAKRFPGKVLHIPVSAHRVGQESRETTQRSRSLLFAALGQVVGHMMGASKVRFYENGIVSHQLPMGPQVVGNMASRTTHPLTIHLLNQLLSLLDVGFMPIENPFQWYTKEDVLRSIFRNGGETKIAEAVSCTSIHGQSKEKTHCGRCSQCLDRRFAVLAADLGQHDPPEAYETDVLIGERSSLNSRTLAYEWTSHAIAKGKLTESDFLTTHGHDLARICRGYPDRATSEILLACHRMHLRQSDYVRRVISDAIARHAGDLSTQALPATSLLIVYVAGPSSSTAESRYTAAYRQISSSDARGDWRDSDTEAWNQPVVHFKGEKGTFVVTVDNLGEVTGSPAHVAHLLLPSFEGDQQAGRLPSEFTFTPVGEIAKNCGKAKEWVRTNVRRCRKLLADFHAEIHGDPPSEHLLIEGRREEGYRLDPRISVFKS